MSAYTYDRQQAQGKAERHKPAARPQKPQDERPTQQSAQSARAEEASRSVMHPESYDPDWRYYHGAWGG